MLLGFTEQKPRLKTRQKGAVLVIVLWVVAMLTIMLAAFTATVKLERQMIAEAEQEVRARQATEAVLNYLAALNVASPQEWVQMPGNTYSLFLNDQLVRFRMLPEAAFVPFNTLEREALERFFAMLGYLDAPDLAVRVLTLRKGGSVDGMQEVEGLRIGSMYNLGELLGLPVERLEKEEYLFSFAGEHTSLALELAQPPVAKLHEQLGLEPAPETEQWREEGLFRVQVETGEGTRVRQFEAIVDFAAATAGYRLVRWSEYNVQFSFE